MTRQLEQLLNLAQEHKDNNIEKPDFDPMKFSEMVDDSNEILNALEISERIDHALMTVSKLNDHDREMDDIGNRAMASYKDLCDLGMNVADAYVGKIYEVAATMLRTAMDARDAKVNRKLKTIDLQLKKAKLDQNYKLKTLDTDESNPGDGFDRNELITYIRTQRNEAESDS